MKWSLAYTLFCGIPLDWSLAFLTSDNFVRSKEIFKKMADLLTFILFFQKSFYAKVRGKKKKKQKSSTEDIVSKHSGVLGLCAFVNAFPYDVPEFVPDILMVLSDHLHDPQPIPVS